MNGEEIFDGDKWRQSVVVISEWLEQEPREKYITEIDHLRKYISKLETQIVEQEPCEDCISRHAVEEITWEEPNYTDALNVLAEVRDKVRALPPVTPQQKVGHWIKIKPYPLQMHDYECSECGHETDDNTENYCSECGAKMEVSKNE